MPAKHRIKPYIENGYYHLYNRGVAKGDIFLDEQDYRVFLSYLKEYLSAPAPLRTDTTISSPKYEQRKNYHSEISLLAFCLMPNHFHFLVQQNQSRSIAAFMGSLFTRYVKYFNHRHQRIGHLLQGNYKGILVEQDNYLIWLSRYIHLNPLELLSPHQPLSNYPYSSYPRYLGLNQTTWLNPTLILSLVANYQQFVESDLELADLSDYLQYALDTPPNSIKQPITLD